MRYYYIMEYLEQLLLIWGIIAIPLVIFREKIYMFQLKQNTKQIQDELNDFLQKELLTRWDEDYNNLINNYGSVENYMNSYIKDFDIMRNNLGVFYKSIQEIKDCNSKNFEISLRAVERISDEYPLKKELMTTLRCQQKGQDESLSQFAEALKGFIESEEKAHSDMTRVTEILDKIEKKYKEVTLE